MVSSFKKFNQQQSPQNLVKFRYFTKVSNAPRVFSVYWRWQRMLGRGVCIFTSTSPKDDHQSKTKEIWYRSYIFWDPKLTPQLFVSEEQYQMILPWYLFENYLSHSLLSPGALHQFTAFCWKDCGFIHVTYIERNIFAIRNAKMQSIWV